MSRIRSNKRQSGVFDSVRKPGGASDEETRSALYRLKTLANHGQLHSIVAFRSSV
jgi:hypothetical protein